MRPRFGRRIGYQSNRPRLGIFLSALFWTLLYSKRRILRASSADDSAALFGVVRNFCHQGWRCRRHETERGSDAQERVRLCKSKNKIKKEYVQVCARARSLEPQLVRSRLNPRGRKYLIYDVDNATMTVLP